MHALRSGLLRMLPVALAATLIAGLLSVPEATAVTASAPTASRSHPFSDPIWYPLRGSQARMDCATSNPGCPTASRHTGGAVTLQTLKPNTKGGSGSYLRQPVYAAGAGIVHIGAVSNYGCGPKAPSLGTWVWIDHGGGIVSRYAHLDNLKVRNGQYVTPTTELATTGNSGEHSTCWVYYLNFQLESNGLYGKGTNLTAMRACVGSRGVRVPQSGTINDIPKGNYVPKYDSDCVPGGAPATNATPTLTSFARSSSSALNLHWKAPSSKPGTVQVEVRLYHPANKSWSLQTRKNLRVASRTPTSYRITGLKNGSHYEGRVSFHGSIGWSAPSRWAVRVPGTVASTPAIRGTKSTRSSLIFLWTKATEHGYPTTRYRVEIHRKSSHGWTTWSVKSVPRTKYSYHPTKLPAHTTYQVRVQAVSAIGASGWATRTVSTTR